MKIHLTKLAVRDLDETEAFIQQDNAPAAARMITRIFEAIEYLVDSPAMGRVGRVPNTRELVVSGTPFLVIYQIRRQNIFVLRILHGARKWP